MLFSGTVAYVNEMFAAVAYVCIKKAVGSNSFVLCRHVVRERKKKLVVSGFRNIWRSSLFLSMLCNSFQKFA
jgi:hypothetical protein